VVWLGDFHEGYKTAPEAQQLLSWVGSKGPQAVQQAKSKQSAKHHSSSQHPHSMHMYMREAADGSHMVKFDVSFPQHLPQHVGDIHNALQQHSRWQNASAAFADLSSRANQQAEFHPSAA